MFTVNDALCGRVLALVHILRPVRQLSQVDLSWHIIFVPSFYAGY